MTTAPKTTPQSDMTGAAMSGTQAEEIEHLRARIAELEAGLRWYAVDAWIDRPVIPPSPDEVAVFGGNIFDVPMPEVLYDQGSRARVLLNGADE